MKACRKVIAVTSLLSQDETKQYTTSLRAHICSPQSGLINAGWPQATTKRQQWWSPALHKARLRQGTGSPYKYCQSWPKEYEKQATLTSVFLPPGPNVLHRKAWLRLPLSFTSHRRTVWNYKRNNIRKITSNWNTSAPWQDWRGSGERIVWMSGKSRSARLQNNRYGVNMWRVLVTLRSVCLRVPVAH